MKLRVSLAALMAVVAILALGLAAMREASAGWLHATYTVTVALLSVGLLGSLLKSRPRGAWVGFTLFGCGAFCLAQVPAAQYLGTDFINTGLMSAIIDRLHQPPAVPSGIAIPARQKQMLSPAEQAESLARSPAWVAEQMQIEILNAGGTVPTAITDFIDQTYDYRARILQASQIAELLRCLILALLGAILGLFLAPRDQTAGRPGTEEPEAQS
jgi:hypothetical protein